MIKTKREAIATHLQEDHAEMPDYRYHYGHTSKPVWAYDNAYYTVTKGKEKPATHRNDSQFGEQMWTWVEVPDRILNEQGFKIWKS